MSKFEHDVEEAATDAKAAITAARRHIAARILDGLRGHPRLLAAIIASLVLAVVALGIVGG